MYPWLDHDSQFDVCIIGGGITGAFCALRLAASGLKTALFSSVPIGYGATAYDTGVLQLAPGGQLYRLSEEIGIGPAVRVLHECENAFAQLRHLLPSLELDCSFRPLGSLLYTSDEARKRDLKREYLLRRHNGQDAKLIDAFDAGDQFAFELESAVSSEHFAAQLNPYLLTHALLQAAQKQGAQVFENTSVEEIEAKEGEFLLHTSTLYQVNCSQLVLASGLSSSGLLHRCGRKKTVYSIATQPLEGSLGAVEGCVIQCMDAPQFTVSATPDRRLLLSGLSSPALPLQQLLPSDQHAFRRFDRLEQLLLELFPGVRGAQAEYSFCVDYLETKDNLPIIGQNSRYENCYFALCGGENGVLYAEIASRMLCDLLERGESDCDDLFSPQRA